MSKAVPSCAANRCFSNFESSASANSATSATLIIRHLCRLVPNRINVVLLFVLDKGCAKPHGCCQTSMSEIIFTLVFGWA